MDAKESMQEEAGPGKPVDERALLMRLRDTLAEAVLDADDNLSGPTSRLLVTCAALLSEREAQLAALSAVAPSTAPPRPDGLPERRGPQRNTMSHVALLREIDPITLQHLLGSCSFRDLAPEEILLTPGRTNRHVYIVMSGSVRVHLDDLTGPPYVELGVGECVGELSILGQTKVTAHVVGNVNTRLMVIDQDLLWLVIDHSPQLARKLLYTLSHRVGSDNLILRRSLRREREFELNANLDALTGISNRRGLTKYFDELIACGKGRDQPLSLLMMDIDHFKRFNDTHGHVLGDNVLCAVAGLLADHATSGLAARYGGEEFSLILPNHDLARACDLAETIRQKIQEVQLWTGQGEQIPPITISIGVKQMEPHDTLKTLVHDADTALYSAKRAGRNCVRRYPSDT